MTVATELDLARENGRAPLIPPFLWAWIGPLLVALLLVVGAGAILVAGETGPRVFEQRIIDAVGEAGIPRHVFRLGLEFGSPKFFAAIVIALALWAAVRRSWPELLACAAVPAAVVIVEQILKPFIDRRYLGYGEFPLCYPSGTATGVAAWTTLTWLLAMPAVRQPGLRLAMAIALALVAGLTALSVVGAHAHYPLDAVAGFATGMGVVLGWAAILDLTTGAHRTNTVAREPSEPVPESERSPSRG